jgi:hypothetical protein
VAYTDRKVRLFHTGTGQELATFDAGPIRPGPIHFLNGGRTLLMHGYVQTPATFLVWDTMSAK